MSGEEKTRGMKGLPPDAGERAGGTKRRGEPVQAAVFSALFLAVLLPVSYMVRTNGDVKDRFAGFYAEKKNSLDVVMIGSSPVFPYYSAPKLWGETGIAMYPLSTNVQRPAAMRYLVEEAEKTQSPELYIFEMGRLRALVAEDDEEGRLSYYLDIMKYHNNWKMLALPSEWANMFYRHRHPLKGYTFRDEVGPRPMPLYSVGGALPIPEEQEGYLRELLAFLKKEGKEALFVVSPYGLSVEEQQMYNYIGDLVNAEGYSFLNMNQCYGDIGIVFEEDFADYGSHTNAVGAEKCTAFLARYLKENYDLPDHRGDSAYASWDEAYALWQEKQAEAVSTIKERIANGDYAEKEE